MLLQSLLTKLAAAGLATKAAAGGAAVVVAASAAGAADTLPDPAQDAFDRLVATAEVEDESGTSDASERAGFGQGVSQDATGESDGEPGVDGAEIACEASEGRSGNCDEGVGTLDHDDASDNSAFGERVSQDATGESDGEPGVDGAEVSAEARASNSGEGAEGADNAPDDVPADGDAGEDGGPEGTPGEDAVDSLRPSDAG